MVDSNIQNSDFLQFSLLWPNSLVGIIAPVRGTLITIDRDPATCSCGIIHNQFCIQDDKHWSCPVCNKLNLLSEFALPQDQTNTSSQILYSNSNPNPITSKLSFIFVIDTVASKEAMDDLKTLLLMTISLLPTNSYITIITFGTDVSIYELSQHGKIIRLKGTERIDPSNIKLSPVQSTTIFAPVELCFEKVISIIESLQMDKQDTPRNVRKSRCTGAAISAAISLASQFPNFVGRIMCFVSGACTYGPGAIVSLRKKHIIRQRNDIIQGKHKKAKKFYDKQGEKLAKCGFCVDVIACSLDQFGLLEMTGLVESAGGIALSCDVFSAEELHSTIRKLFERNSESLLPWAFNATLDIKVSADVKINGIIGNCTALQSPSPSVSEVPIGIGGTSRWKVNVLDEVSSLACYFQLQDVPNGNNEASFIQFTVRYVNSIGHSKTAVFTTVRNRIENIEEAFNVDVTANGVMRQALERIKTSEDVQDVQHWLDNCLLDIEQQPQSAGSSKWQELAAFIGDLKHSPLITGASFSPDEIAYMRFWGKRQTLSYSRLIIQPKLYCATIEDEHLLEIPLSSNCLASNRILVLYSFFHVVIWYGEWIAAWKNGENLMGEELPGNRLETLLDEIKLNAQMELARMMPVARFIETNDKHPNARFLTAKLSHPNLLPETPVSC